MRPHLQRGRGSRGSPSARPRAHSPQRTSSLGLPSPKPEPLLRTEHCRSQVAAGASVLVSRARLCKSLWVPVLLTEPSVPRPVQAAGGL